LKKYGIEAERRSIIEDIDALNHYGMDIQLDENGKSRKSLDREFEISEIRMLVDCIASSKFLPEEKSKALIDKLLKLLSLYQRNKIIRRVELSYCKKKY
jgi:predicted DNA-binding transcriptional regulator YafY